MRKWLQQYFTFNNGERRAIIIIVTTTVVIVAGINGYRYYQVNENEPKAYAANVDAFIAAYNAEESNVPRYSKQAAKQQQDSANKQVITTTTYAMFDPNTIGQKDWIKLGFSEKQAASIEKYKTKGGRFYKVEDLKKLYVVSDDDYKRIAPYVSIQSKHVNKNIKPVNLNSADSLSLEALPGIGAVSVQRILEHRAKHGNFKTVEELKQIKGMSDENYNKVAPYLSTPIYH